MDLSKKSTNIITMKYPASWHREMWREGLVSGNGIVGINVYGGTKNETVLINHSGLWHNGFSDSVPDVSDTLEKTRTEMDNGNFKQASWILTNALKEKQYKTELQSPLPMADLHINMTPISGFSKYLRGIDMETGEVGCEWYDNDVFVKKEMFVSRADDVIVYNITSSEPLIKAEFSIDIHGKGKKLPDFCDHILNSKQIQVQDNFLCYCATNIDGTDYGVVVKILSKDGQLVSRGESISVSNSSDILILAKVFIKGNSKIDIQKQIQELSCMDNEYDWYLNRHKKLHEKLYNSASLQLGENENRCNEELLLQAYSETSSNELIEKMWHYGRYLFICGTCVDGLPFPLYGIWGGEYGLIWCHNMANENTQMIYWHTSVGNLLEFNQALFEYYNSMLEQFRINAKNLYGCNGIYMTAGTTPDVSTPNQVVPVIMNWVGAAGWIAQHYYKYYLYTKDTEFLKQTILPFMDEVANFYEDFITFYPDGNIKFYPSVSPENTPENFMPPEGQQMAHPMPTTINSTIDLAIVKEFFTNMLAIADEQGIYNNKIDVWKKIIKSIPEYAINSDGAIREWQDKQFDDRYDHRHLSHIYPVFPGDEVNTENNPDLIKSFEKAVELRKIDAQTGWSLSHMAAIYARFERGNDVMKCLDDMAKSSILNNLFTLHNDWRNMSISLSMESAPVQLDAALGYVNAVQEMILYSSNDLIKLLPSLADGMKYGRVRAFRFCGGTVDIEWDIEKNKFEASFTSERDIKIDIKLPKQFSNYVWNENKCTIDEKQNGVICVSFSKGSTLKIKNN